MTLLAWSEAPKGARTALAHDSPRRHGRRGSLATGGHSGQQLGSLGSHVVLLRGRGPLPAAALWSLRSPSPPWGLLKSSARASGSHQSPAGLPTHGTVTRVTSLGSRRPRRSVSRAEASSPGKCTVPGASCGGCGLYRLQRPRGAQARPHPRSSWPRLSPSWRATDLGGDVGPTAR